MTNPAALEPARLPPVDAARRIGDLFRRCALNEGGLLRTLGVREMAEASALDLQTRLARTAGTDAQHQFIRLFFFGVPVNADLLSAAIAPMTVAEWIDWGLLRTDTPGEVRAGVQLYPDGDQVFATDMPQFENGRMVVPDACVMTPGATTKAVKMLAIRRPVETALDVGTGCGILGIFAAGYARRAFATDLTQRSVDFTRFNAALNGIENLEALRGSLLEPVKDRRFDAIISNPPFVISPSNRYIYRDGGMHGDMFVQSLIRQAADVLNPGGTLQMLFDWAHVRGQHPAQRVASWFQGLGCDALVMRVSGMAPLDYAKFWTRQLEDNAGPEAQRQAIEHWLDYYRTQGIEGMSHGHLSLRKLPAGAMRQPSVMVQEQRAGVTGNISEQVRRLLWNLDTLAMDDQSMLSRAFVPAPELRIRQDVTPPGAHPQAASNATGVQAAAEFSVLLRGGLGTTMPSSPDVARLVMSMNASKPIGRIVEEIAQASGRGASAIAGPVVMATRKLLEAGMIEAHA